MRQGNVYCVGGEILDSALASLSHTAVRSSNALSWNTSRRFARSVEEHRWNLRIVHFNEIFGLIICKSVYLSHSAKESLMSRSSGFSVSQKKVEVRIQKEWGVQVTSNTKQQRLRMEHGVLDVKMTFDETPCFLKPREKSSRKRNVQVHTNVVWCLHPPSVTAKSEIFATSSAWCLPPLICWCPLCWRDIWWGGKWVPFPSCCGINSFGSFNGS